MTIKELRATLNLSQSQFGGIIGVDRSELGKMENGKKKGYNEITLGENEYYCLGDNRPVSNDSRNLGPFTADRIKAVAVIRVYPVNEIKILT